LRKASHLRPNILAEYVDFFALNARLFAVFIQHINPDVYSAVTPVRTGCSAPAAATASVAQRGVAHAPA
jgi:hypothetical protein